MIKLRLLTRALVAVLALAAFATGLWHLLDARSGVTLSRAQVGPIPVTVFAPEALAHGGAAPLPGPLVVITHGFAGSQQLMQPLALTLARNGYRAVTFDFPGHGRNLDPLSGTPSGAGNATETLQAALAEVVAYARTLPGFDGRLALLGHSMASDIIIRYAQAHPEIAATVVISVFSPAVSDGRSPRNLEVVVGALEPPFLRDEGRRIVGLSAGPEPVAAGVTYGRFDDGSARRLVLAPGVEHISVLYSGEAETAAVDWFNQVFGRSEAIGFVDTRGPWLGLLFLGVVALTWPVSKLLPRLTRQPLGAGLPWRRLLPVAIVPAVATPLILTVVPSDFLPLLLGDYLVCHFALYGLLTLLGLWLARLPQLPPSPLARTSSWWASPLLWGALAALYAVLALAWPIDTFITGFWPTGVRWGLVLALMAGTVIWFVADEWLTRGLGAPRAAYALTKVLFLGSIALAIALDLPRLFFLIIIVPVIVAFFVIYGLFSHWAYRATGHPLVGALANAAGLAWAIATTFPLVAR